MSLFSEILSWCVTYVLLHFRLRGFQSVNGVSRRQQMSLGLSFLEQFGLFKEGAAACCDSQSSGLGHPFSSQRSLDSSSCRDCSLLSLFDLFFSWWRFRRSLFDLVLCSSQFCPGALQFCSAKQLCCPCWLTGLLLSTTPSSSWLSSRLSVPLPCLPSPLAQTPLSGSVSRVQLLSCWHRIWDFSMFLSCPCSVCYAALPVLSSKCSVLAPSVLVLVWASCCLYALTLLPLYSGFAGGLVTRACPRGGGGGIGVMVIWSALGSWVLPP